MNQPLGLPHRPRLVEHAELRRHVIDGRSQAFIFDTRAEEAIEIEDRHLSILLGMDGTRDVGGLSLAAVQRGAYRRASEVSQLLTRLHQQGLLTDGIAPRPLVAPSFPDRPLEVLGDFLLRCDANGACCSTYSAVPFSQVERQRSLALVPEVRELSGGASECELGDESVFLPMKSSGASSLCTVTLHDGRCAFLAEDNRCRVQNVGGPEAKPAGCNIFPATFVDDGTAVRVSVGVECPCVLASLGGNEGSTLAPAGARTESDLRAGCNIVRLPEQISVTAGQTAARLDLRRWAEAVEAELDNCPDVLHGFWSLAEAVSEHGLDPDAARRAVVKAEAPPVAAFGFRLMALASKTRNKRETSERWRSLRDRCRQLSVWLDDAAQALLESGTQVRALAEVTHPAHEAFYFRTVVVGHQLVTADLNLVQALRDRATRLLLARQLPHCVPSECAEDPAVDYPLSAVEMMMRGQGLYAYARGMS